MISEDLPPLRPYQDEAAQLAYERGSMLFALTMGSGKTRVALETIDRLADAGDVESGCIFVLNSTKFQWQREVEKWVEGSVQVINGDKNARKWQYRRAERFRYNILNYECVVHDWEDIQDYLPVDFIVCDEVTALKSFTSQRSKRLKEMATYAPFRFGLSGQPVENMPEDLYSIMEFVDPSVLGPFHKFDKAFIERDRFGKPKKYRNLDLLAKTMEPAMYRRSRADLAEFLPKVQNLDLPVRLDSWSQKLYNYLRDDLLDSMESLGPSFDGFDIMAHYGKADSSGSLAQMGKVMSRMTVMRLLCDHPQLVVKSAERFDDLEALGGSEYAQWLANEGMLDGAPNKSAKLDALVDLVEEILSEDPTNKVVIFSGFTSMLDIIEPVVRRLATTTRIDGSVASKDRDKRIVKFNEDPKCRIFLSSDAGAYGVNLDKGSHLISYDLPWSSGSFAQRVARIDRLSSIHDTISVHTMYVEGAVEQWQAQMLAQKGAIADAVLDGDHKAGELSLDLASLKEFLVNSVSS